MRIERYCSEQFAGILDFDIKFEKGMNVVLGKNETGKSTMIAAIYHALFTSSKIDRRKHREFIQTFFPSSGIETMDAKLVLLKNQDRYIVEKVWDQSGMEALSKLRAEAGEVWRGKQAEEKLGQILEYGDAVYEYLVFGHQNYEREILEWFYQFFSSKGDQDIIKIRQKLREAFSVAGGISEEKFIAVVEEKIKSLSGRWDFVKDRPEKGRELENYWKNGRGEILDAYYAYRQAEQEYATAIKIEKDLEIAQKKRQEYREKVKQLDNQREKLENQKIEILQKNQLETLIKNTGETLEECEDAAEKWPIAMAQTKKAKKLQRFQRESEKRRQKHNLQTLCDEIEQIEEEILEFEKKERDYIGLEEEVMSAREARRRVENSKVKLASSKLLADIVLTEGQNANICFVDGTKKVVKSQETVTVNGGIRIEIPGVAQIRVDSKEIDVSNCQFEISKYEKIYSDILKKYLAKSLEELEEKLKQIKEISGKKQISKSILEQKLCGRTKDEIKREKESITEREDISIPDFLEEEIEKFLNDNKKISLESCIAGNETRLEEYGARYGNLEQLKKKIEYCKKEIEEKKERLGQLGEVESISEIEYERRKRFLEEELEKMREESISWEREIGVLLERESSELAELEGEVSRRKKEWEKQKQIYQYCGKIKEDFIRLKSETANQFEHFYKKLNQNLEKMARYQITVECEENLKIISGKNNITKKEFLSEGTKKTILLAFRLAILEYFYEEEGFLILDDSLLDMDPERREGAAELLKAFADKNQVIFTTCDPLIAKRLGGNLIQI